MTCFWTAAGPVAGVLHSLPRRLDVVMEVAGSDTVALGSCAVVVLPCVESLVASFLGRPRFLLGISALAFAEAGVSLGGLADIPRNESLLAAVETCTGVMGTRVVYFAYFRDHLTPIPGL